MNAEVGPTRPRNGANLGHAHLLNQRVILEIVRLHGPISRVDMAGTADCPALVVGNTDRADQIFRSHCVVERFQDSRSSWGSIGFRVRF
jgi:hypothetical protein